MGNHQFYLANATAQPLEYRSPDHLHLIQRGRLEPTQSCQLPPCKTVEILVGRQWLLINLAQSARVAHQQTEHCYLLEVIVDPERSTTLLKVVQVI